jgi:hypothetical protein
VIFYQAPSHATKLGLPPPQSYGFGATLDGLVGQMTSGTMTEMLSLQNDQLLESKFHMLVEQMAVSTMAEMMPFHSDQTLECKAHGLIEQLPANAMRETMSLLNEPIPTTEVEGLAGKWPANEPKPAFGDVADMAFSELVERRGGRTLKLKKLYFVDEER